MLVPHAVQVGGPFEPVDLYFVASHVLIPAHMQRHVHVADQVHEEAQGKPFTGFGSGRIFQLFDHGHRLAVKVLSFCGGQQPVVFLPGAMAGEVEIMPGRSMVVDASSVRFDEIRPVGDHGERFLPDDRADGLLCLWSEVHGCDLCYNAMPYRSPGFGGQTACYQHYGHPSS